MNLRSILWLVQRQERGRVCLVSPVAAKGSAGRDLARTRAWRRACGGLSSCSTASTERNSNLKSAQKRIRKTLRHAGAAWKTTLGPIWQQDLPRGSQVAWHRSRGVSSFSTKPGKKTSRIAENPGSNCPRHRLRPMEEPPTKIGRGLHGVRGEP